MKSPPELWSQCSDPLMLAKHLTSFGEITITRLEPESTVAWEGESVSGTVTLEESGWGTKVRLTALARATASAPAVVPVLSEVVPVLSHPAQSAPAPPPRSLSALVSSILRRRREDAAAAVAGHPVPDAAAEAETAPVSAAVTAPADLVAELEAALDSLGQAHHRPYSRA